VAHGTLIGTGQRVCASSFEWARSQSGREGTSQSVSPFSRMRRLLHANLVRRLDLRPGFEAHGPSHPRVLCLSLARSLARSLCLSPLCLSVSLSCSLSLSQLTSDLTASIRVLEARLQLAYYLRAWTFFQTSQMCSQLSSSY